VKSTSKAKDVKNLDGSQAQIRHHKKAGKDALRGEEGDQDPFYAPIPAPERLLCHESMHQGIVARTSPEQVEFAACFESYRSPARLLRNIETGEW